MVVPLPKLYRLGVRFVRAGEGFAEVCRTPTHWHVFVAVTRPHQDLPLLVMKDMFMVVDGVGVGDGAKERWLQ